LGFGMAAILTRMTRASVLECLGEDYVRTARAKGVGRARILTRHALRNALAPVVTILGLQFGALLAGTVITETIFAWPGLGRLLIDAINQRDYPVVQGCILTIAAGFVLLSLTLLTGILFVDNLFAQHLAHKTVLSILAWVVFGALLYGRRAWGWRGRRAVNLTLAGMAILLLAFFGSKFVLELVLHRTA